MTDLKTIVNEQRKFYLSGQTRNEDFRKRNLEKLKKAIDKYKDQLFEALKYDLNKSEFEASMTELSFVYEEIRYALKNLEKWMKAERAVTSLQAMPAKSYSIYEPLGVTLIISPWNYPVMLTLDPLVAAIASGNTIIIKTSRKSKNTSRVLRQMINQSFDRQYIHILDNEIISHSELLEEKYDHIFFTGSSKVGREIMQKASKNLTKVSLELGGKSPCIVDDTANISLAAKRIMWGKLLNAGQTCVAPDYVICHKSIKEELLVCLKTAIIEFFGSNPIDNLDYPSLIDQQSYNRLTDLIKNQNIYYGGEKSLDKLKIEPTIVDQVSWNNRLMDEEIFGPILPILEYEDMFELIKKLRPMKKPLALYVFSEDEEHINRFIYDLSYGNACINDTIMQVASSNLEFGGVGDSGMGGYHGKYGFINFSNRRSVLDRKTSIDINLRYPPYSKGQRAILKFLEN